MTSSLISTLYTLSQGYYYEGILNLICKTLNTERLSTMPKFIQPAIGGSHVWTSRGGPWIPCFNPPKCAAQFHVSFVKKRILFSTNPSKNEIPKCLDFFIRTTLISFWNSIMSDYSTNILMPLLCRQSYCILNNQHCWTQSQPPPPLPLSQFISLTATLTS